MQTVSTGLSTEASYGWPVVSLQRQATLPASADTAGQAAGGSAQSFGPALNCDNLSMTQFLLQNLRCWLHNW